MHSKIRMQADDFFNAYQVLKESNEIIFANADNLAETSLQERKAFGCLLTMGPSVVCLAFSVELYMKNIHFFLNDQAPRGHNIFKLYSKLPKQIKRDIFAHASIGQNPFVTRGPILHNKRFTGISSDYYGFLLQIKTISDGFEKWRYSYEYVNLRYEEWFALAFIESIKSTTNNIRTR